MLQDSPKRKFTYTCQGGFGKSQFSQLVLRNRQVNRPFEDICQGAMIRMAYNQYQYIFELDKNDSMVEYPWDWGFGKGPRAHDILSTFFASQKLTPTWKECNGNWGKFNKTTGLWTGAVAEVSKLFRGKV